MERLAEKIATDVANNIPRWPSSHWALNFQAYLPKVSEPGKMPSQYWLLARGTTCTGLDFDIPSAFTGEYEESFIL